MPGNCGMIDLETPQHAYTKNGYYDGQTMELVFSDEFNTDGRTFYPGDDPYWEAVDLHYWQVGPRSLLISLIASNRYTRLLIWSGMILQRSQPRMALYRSHFLKYLITGWNIWEASYRPGINSVLLVV